MKSKRIWRFRKAELFADMANGTTIYRLMSRGWLVATDQTPKYLKEIMYQVG